MSKTYMPDIWSVFEFGYEGDEGIGPVYRVTETNARFDGETAKVTIGLETEESLNRLVGPGPEGPKPKATVEEIRQRAQNNLHKAVRDGDVEDARSWAGLLAMLG